MSEADISAEQSQAKQETRLSSPDGDPRRSGHPAGTPAQGSPAPVSLIWRVRGRDAFRAFHPPRHVAESTRATRARIGPVTVSFVNGNPAEPPRVAYAIGRKVGNAVERNRIRRQLRTILIEVATQLRPGMYLIGVAPHATPLRFGELRLTVMRALDAIWQKESGRETSRPQTAGQAAS
jgi:ribonuclease P protein component